MPYNKIVFSVGLFILFTSTLILVSLVYVIERKGMFEHHTKYQLLATNAENIEEGMPVLFSGFEVGQVQDLGLHDSGEVLVTISVPQHNKKWLRSGSLFILENPLIGKAKITLKSSMSKPPLEEGVILRMYIEDGINEIITNIQPVVLELQSIVSNIKTLSGSLADQNASFQTSLKHAETFSSKLASSPSILASVTGDQNSAVELQKAIINLNLTLEDIRTIVKNANEGVIELREDIIHPVASDIQELSLIIKDVRKKLKSMDNVVATIGDSDGDVKYFKDEIKVLIDEMSELSTRINAIIGEESQDHVALP